MVSRRSQQRSKLSIRGPSIGKWPATSISPETDLRQTETLSDRRSAHSRLVQSSLFLLRQRCERTYASPLTDRSFHLPVVSNLPQSGSPAPARSLCSDVRRAALPVLCARRRCSV